MIYLTAYLTGTLVSYIFLTETKRGKKFVLDSLKVIPPHSQCLITPQVINNYSLLYSVLWILFLVMILWGKLVQINR